MIGRPEGRSCCSVSDECTTRVRNLKESLDRYYAVYENAITRRIKWASSHQGPIS